MILTKRQIKTLMLSSQPKRDFESIAIEVLRDEYDAVSQISPDGDVVDVSREIALAMRDALTAQGWQFREAGHLSPGGDEVPEFMWRHLTNEEIFR